MAFCVSVSDAATYWFENGETKEEAINKAWDYFNEREPNFEVEEYDPNQRKEN